MWLRPLILIRWQQLEYSLINLELLCRHLILNFTDFQKGGNLFANKALPHIMFFLISTLVFCGMCQRFIWIAKEIVVVPPTWSGDSRASNFEGWESRAVSTAGHDIGPVLLFGGALLVFLLLKSMAETVCNHVNILQLSTVHKTKQKLLYWQLFHMFPHNV